MHWSPVVHSAPSGNGAGGSLPPMPAPPAPPSPPSPAPLAPPAPASLEHSPHRAPQPSSGHGSLPQLGVQSVHVAPRQPSSQTWRISPRCPHESNQCTWPSKHAELARAVQRGPLSPPPAPESPLPPLAPAAEPSLPP